MKNVAGALSLFITLPIWYYLVYQILARVNASELMWFLYWIYVPLGSLVQILSRMVEGSGK